MRQILVAVVSVLFITSCFHYEEEMVLKEDGSGEVTVRFVFGKFISSMMDLDNEVDSEDRQFSFRLRNDEGLKILDDTVYERHGRRVYEVTIQFDHYKYLRNLDIESDEYDDDMEMDIRDFFEDIQFDGEKFVRRIDLGNNDGDDDDVPRFVKKMVDVQFSFSVKIKGKESKEWIFDIEDLANKRELIMRVN